ncbi:MAG TPA: hypothetical protein VGB31_09720, partial [Myxococcota bacterium]
AESEPEFSDPPPPPQPRFKVRIKQSQGPRSRAVEVVRKVIVPSHLLKVAHGGVGVRIINAPEGYYHFMEALGITADSSRSGPANAKNRSANSDRIASGAKAEPKPELSAELSAELSDPSPRVAKAESKPKHSAELSDPSPRVAKAESEPEFSDPPPPPQPRFKVRIKQSQGPRSRAVEVAAESHDDARRQVLADVGDGWIALGVERVDAD